MATSRTRTTTGERSSWASTAFIVEAIVLLVALIASLAILVLVFTSALDRSVESRTLDAATIAASSIAEHFAANPNDVQEETVLGDLRITCTVSDEARAAGTMRHARIDVFDLTAKPDAKPIYTIETARYEGGES